MSSSRVLCIKPFQYIHVLDKNVNTKRIIIGPKNYPLQDHEEVVSKGVENMIVIPNLHYVIIKNPVSRDVNGEIILDKFKLPKINFGKSETRTRDLFKGPFPLFPNEELQVGKTPLKFVEFNQALHLRAKLFLIDSEGKEREPGEEWRFDGPNHYTPNEEIEIVRTIDQEIIKKGEALWLKATKECYDSKEEKRNAGEEWLVQKEGAYMPNVNEQKVKTVKGYVIDEMNALHLRALYDYTDKYQNNRSAGEEWLITNEISNFHIPEVFEEVVRTSSLYILGQDNYCIVLNPYDDEKKKNKLGARKFVPGPTSFFLKPGEILQGNDIQNIQILGKNESLLLQAEEDFEETNEKKEKVIIKAGSKWMINGPIRYAPNIHVSILEKRSVIPLDKNEGIYIRNTRSGKIFTHFGKSYLLGPDEVLWEKNLPAEIEKIYVRDENIKIRDKTRVITYQCPYNAIMQIYNLKKKTNRIVFGPELAILEPTEEFTLMSLSGKTPKLQNIVKTLYLKLGPIFSSDSFDVETEDHTRLQLGLSYNWKFNLKRGEDEKALQIFQIRDFIGDLCNTMASKIRSFIATQTFENFHKNSDKLIKRAAFGPDFSEENLDNFLNFDKYNLSVTDVDIKSVTPTDPNTNALLQKSVSLAIILATKIIEQEYKIQLQMKEQEFKGELEKLAIQNEIEFLGKRIEYNQCKVESEIREKTGLSRAQAEAEKEAAIIESSSKVELAKLSTEAKEIEEHFKLKIIEKQWDSI